MEPTIFGRDMFRISIMLVFFLGSFLFISPVLAAPPSEAPELEKLKKFDKRIAKTIKKMNKYVGSWKRSGKSKNRSIQHLNEVRKNALSRIFDLEKYIRYSRYKVTGQKEVDEQVNLLRPVWKSINGMLTRDTALMAKLTSAKASGMWRRLDNLYYQRIKLEDALKRQSIDFPKRPMLPALTEAAFQIRAGRRAPDIDLSNNPWLVECLQRVRDLHAGDVNRMLLAKPLQEGKKPSGSEYQLIKRINNYRQMFGRVALRVEPHLVDSCRGHAKEMNSLAYFGHNSPISKRKTPSMRAELAGYHQMVFENIADIDGESNAYLLWYNSPPHHRNMLDPQSNVIGAGNKSRLWVVNLAR